MRKFSEACETRDKYKDELIRLGASSVHVNLRKQPANAGHESFRIFIVIRVPNSETKISIQNFLASQKHPGRLDRFYTEVLIPEKRPRKSHFDTQKK